MEALSQHSEERRPGEKTSDLKEEEEAALESGESFRSKVPSMPSLK